MYPAVCGIFSRCCTQHVSLSGFSPGLISCVRRDTQRYRQRLIGLRCTSLSRWARPAAQPRLSPRPSFHMNTQRLCLNVHCTLIVGHSLVTVCLLICTLYLTHTRCVISQQVWILKYLHLLPAFRWFLKKILKSQHFRFLHCQPN